jgi:hypothetical protein
LAEDVTVELLNQCVQMMRRGDLPGDQGETLAGYVRMQADTESLDILRVAAGGIEAFREEKDVRELIERIDGAGNDRLRNWLLDALLRELDDQETARRVWDSLEDRFGSLPPVPPSLPPVQDFVERWNERRGGRGVTRRLPITVTYTEGDRETVEGKTIDIRRGGTWAVFSSPVREWATVSVKLQSDDGVIIVEEATVIRSFDYDLSKAPAESKYPYGRAIRFLRYGEQAQEALNRLISGSST